MSATTATTEIRIFGPNLTRAASAKGTLHAHAANCGDCKHYGRGRRFGGEDDGWKISVKDRREITHEVYPPEEFDYEPSDWRDGYGDDIHIAPCLAHLPDEVDEVEPTLTLTLTITLGNEGMRGTADLARALQHAAADLAMGDQRGVIRDPNGNTVGQFAIEEA